MTDVVHFPDDGLDLLRDFMCGDSIDPPLGMEIDKDDTATDTGTTANTDPSGCYSPDSIQKEGTGIASFIKTWGFTQENGTAIKGIALLDGTTGSGTDKIYCRRTGTTINKTEDVLLRGEFQIEITNNV